MGPFLIAMRQLKLLMVGIDYFTKWVEVETLATITKKTYETLYRGTSFTGMAYLVY